MRLLTVGAILTSLFVSGLTAADKLVFSCDFSNGYKPQESVQPLRIDPARVQIVDIPGGKALRIGKKEGKRAGRVNYLLTKTVNAKTLVNNMHPYPLRFGKLQFRFRPVGWTLKDSGYNMLLRMEGPKGNLLHVIYLRPKGVPSIQVAYGQQKNPNIGKGEIPLIYPYTKLDPNKEWHDVTVKWNPQTIELNIDGNTVSMSTKTLAYPQSDFYAENMYLGYGLSNLSLGETDITDLKIWATEPEEDTSKKKSRFPELTVNPMPEPVIDGVIADSEWKNVSSYTGFLKLPKNNLTEHQPVVKIGYDKKNLYIAFQSNGHSRTPLMNQSARDSRVWKDDCIELYFAKEGDKGNFYQIVLNHAGAVFDQYSQSGKSAAECSSWNCAGLKTATKVSNGVWCTETAVPFAALGIPSPEYGKTLLFNIGEGLIGTGYFSLASVKVRFAEFERFGILKFGNEDSPVIDFSDVGGLFRGEAEFRCGVSGKSPVQMEVSAKRYDQTADTEFALFSELVPVQKVPSICFRADSGKLKKNGILYTKLLQQGKTIYSSRFFYEAAMTAEIENIRREVRNGKNYFRITTAQMNDGKSKLHLTLTGLNGVKKAENTVAVTASKQISYLDISKVAPGKYKLGGALLDKNGKAYQKFPERDVIVYGKQTPWKGFVRKNIRTDYVPAPWTPLKVKKSGEQIQVSCWNRVYTFGKGSLFAEQITTAGIPLLKTPVKLFLKQNGKKIEISGITQKIISSGDRNVVIESIGSIADGGKITVRIEIEYDGFIWNQVTADVKKGASLDRFYLQADIPKQYSTLLNCGFRDLQNTGRTPEYWSKSLEGISGPFWVGMEKGGLSFGIESAENWSNKTITTQAEVIRGKNETNIRLNFVDVPVKVKKNLSYGFYIHPTPVRPRPQGFRKLRAQDWITHNKTAVVSNTFYPTNFSWWITTFYYQGHPDWAVETEDIKKNSLRLQKEYTRNKHAYQFRTLDKKFARSAWYAAYSSIGRNAPEVIWNGDDWFAGPQERLYGNTLYGYDMDMIEVCKTEDYCDFYLWRFDQTKKGKQVVDGLYFDLWGASSCNRKDHNHGYVTADGIRRPVHPIREHRKWLELIYLYCKESADNAPIVCHVSGATAHISGYSYADYLLDGELWFDQLAKDRSYKSMPLDMARAEILTHIWGPGVIWLSELHRAKGYVPASLQKTWALEPWAMRHFSAILLLHDSIPDRTSLFETARHIWYALDRFHLEDQDIFLPYWESCGISGDNDGKNSAVTAYLKKKENRMMLVVFNNRDQKVNSKIKLDVRKIFGFDGKIKVSDLETGKMLITGKTEFSVPVGKRNFRLLQVLAEK
ncbi:MAG: hypothetical protein IKB25_05730 [Lentisphaeria bacterium]|nr:hypothetical protein [Lentisphaeria bacterium]